MHLNRLKRALDARREIQTVFPPSDAPIVYRLGQEILILQSGVRFPVGAPNICKRSDRGTRRKKLPRGLVKSHRDHVAVQITDGDSPPALFPIFTLFSEPAIADGHPAN